MNQEILSQSQDSIVNSSTSSYSQIIPREQMVVQTKKDRPIIMKSIPISQSKIKLPIDLNQSEQKASLNTLTLINSTHANTIRQKQQFSAEVYKNQILNQNSDRRYSISKEQSIPYDQNYNKLIKSSYEMSKTNLENIQNNYKIPHYKKQQQIISDNITLNYSRSSNSSGIKQKIQKKIFLITQTKHNQEILSNQKQVQKQHSPQLKNNTYFQINTLTKFQILDNDFQIETKKSNQIMLDHFILSLVKQKKQSQTKKNDSLSLKIDNQKSQQKLSLQKQITLKNEELQKRIRKLQNLLKSQIQNNQIQIKANQIYTDFYQNLSKIIKSFLDKAKNKQTFFQFNISQNQSLNQSLNMEKIIDFIQNLMSRFQKPFQIIKNLSQKQIQTQFINVNNKQNTREIQFLYQKKIEQIQNLLRLSDQNNSKLKNQLLQSTQNNINSIFNTQISASCCLQNQVAKINNQMALLKQKINSIKTQQYSANNSQSHFVFIPHSTYSQQLNSKQKNKDIKKIVKIYTTKDKINQSEQYSDEYSEQKKRSRDHSLNNKKKRKNNRSISSSSQLSSKSTKKRQQVSKMQLQKIKQAYNKTKQELNSLINTFSLITKQQTDMKHYFSQIKNQIIQNLKQNISLNQEKCKQRNKKENYQIYTLQRNLYFKRQQQLILAQKLNQNSQKFQAKIQSIQSQRFQDKKLIQNLNTKIIQVLDAISLPQKINQQIYNYKCNYYQQQQFPVSQISISVDILRQVQVLKQEKIKQDKDLYILQRQNQYLKQQIIKLSALQKRTSAQNVHINSLKQRIQDGSVNSSRQRNQSIIYELNGFTQMQIQSPPSQLQIKRYMQNHNKIPSNKIVHFKSKEPHLNDFPRVKSSKIFNFQNRFPQKQMKTQIKAQSMKNLQNNYKVVLSSKQKDIKLLQQKISQFQENNNLLRKQITYKQNAITQLETYIDNLNNKSKSNVSLSGIGSSRILNNNLNMDGEDFHMNIKLKYQNYIKNLKILLKQSNNQNQILKQQIQNFQIQNDQRTQSNLALKNSATHSQRTTKNFPSSSSPGTINSRAHGQVLIRKRGENYQKNQNQAQQQKINIFSDDQLKHSPNKNKYSELK